MGVDFVSFVEDEGDRFSETVDVGEKPEVALFESGVGTEDRDDQLHV